MGRTGTDGGGFWKWAKRLFTGRKSQSPPTGGTAGGHRPWPYQAASPPPVIHSSPPVVHTGPDFTTGLIVGHMLGGTTHHTTVHHTHESPVSPPPPTEPEAVVKYPEPEVDRTWGTSGGGSDWSSPPSPPPPPESPPSYDYGSSSSSYDSGSSGGGGGDW